MNKQSKSKMKNLLNKFKRNVAGIAAVEFALIAPLLMLMLFGALEVSRAVMMHKRFQRATAMIGDLVSREESIGESAGQGVLVLNGMMLSAAHIMQPFDMATFNIGVFHVRAISATQTQADWQYTSSGGAAGSALITCVPKAMPAAGMVNVGNAAIVVESSYTYTPLFASLAPPGFGVSIPWTDTITHSPRQRNIIPLDTPTGPNC
jgi:Flp pilus assembly protein TadG